MADPPPTGGTGTTISQLRSTVAQRQEKLPGDGCADCTARLDKQAAQIQKVGTQLAIASPSLAGLEASKFGAG